MSDDDDSYSFDDDFASTSQDERLGLHSICEEPEHSENTVPSQYFPPTQNQPAAAADNSIDTARSEHSEVQHDKSNDSYSLDQDFASVIQDEEPAGRPSSSNNDTDSQQCQVVETNDSYYSLDKDFDSATHNESYIGEVVVEPECASTDVRTNKAVQGDTNEMHTNSTNDSRKTSIASNKSAAIETDEENKENQSIATTKQFMNQVPINCWDNGKHPKDFEECKEDPKERAGSTDSRADQLFHWQHKTQKQRKPPAPLPRCATLTTKSSRSHKEPEDTDVVIQPKHKYSKKRLQELARPRKHHMYVKNDDSTQANNVKKKPTDDISSFLERMEMLEQMRREKAESAAAEAQYNAKVDIDKLRCPNCGRIQSYTESVANSMTCTTEGCKKKKINYQKTQRKTKDFLERLERSKQRKSAKVKEILLERRSSLSAQCLEKSQLQKQLTNKISSNGQDFITRMQRDVNARQTKMSRHVELMDESLNKAHSFKPMIHIPEHLICNRKGGLASLAAPARRYTQTFEERLEECERKQGKNMVLSKNKRAPIESLWGQGSTTQKRYTRHN